jgi:formylmethanofuran dehydrogenase subunit D
VYEEDDFDVNQFADEYEDDSDVGMLDDDDLELLNDSEEDFDVNKFADEYEDDSEVGNLEDDDLELLKDWDNEEDFDENLLSEGQTFEKRHYLGCPAFNRQNY